MQAVITELLYVVILWTMEAQSFQQPCHLVRQYSPDFLMQWDDPNHADMHMDPLLIQDLNKVISKYRTYKWDRNYSANVRRQGKRGGVSLRLRLRLKPQKLRCIPLPSMIVANVQSLRNKTDNLQA